MLLGLFVTANGTSSAPAAPVTKEVSGFAEPARTSDPNSAVLAAIRTMPVGGAYAVNRVAKEQLIASVRLEPRGLLLDPKVAQPSFCSGATYLVFLRALEQLARNDGLALDAKTLDALLVKGQADGKGIWGRWNANGPGTARLFHELGLGQNFVDPRSARAGDFLKIFWTGEIGQKERGHSVIYLGTEMVGGVEHVRFWSSNQPDGYGEKSVPRTKVARMIFSRLEKPANVVKASALNGTDQFLASMLVRRFTMSEIVPKCGM